MPRELTPEEVQQLGLAPPAPQRREITPEQAQALLARAKPDAATIAGRGAASGLTFGFADELTSALETAFPILKTTVGDISRGQTRSMPASYQENRAENRQLHQEAREANPALYTGAEIAASLAAPGGAAKSVGKLGLKELVKAGARQGAIAGLGNSEADLTSGNLSDYGRALLDTTVGGAFGGAAGAAGAGVAKVAEKGGGALRRVAGGKVAKIERDVAERAAAEAADVTNSARGQAGAAAQDAYRQLEHLRELGRKGMLSPEEARVFRELSEELGDKAQEKLLPAAARKAEKAAAYQEAMESEVARAAKLAEEKLSTGELKRQALARIKRYGLPALGGYIGAQVLGVDPMVGLAVGGAGGHAFRPMLHSLLRLGKSPAVQQRAWSALDKLGRGLGGKAATPLQQLEEEALALGARGLSREGASRPLKSFQDAYKDATPAEVEAIAAGQMITKNSKNWKFDPVTVERDISSNPMLSDGNHRLEAAMGAGAKKVRAKLKAFDDARDDVVEKELLLPILGESRASILPQILRAGRPAVRELLQSLPKQKEDAKERVKPTVDALRVAGRR